MHIDNISQSPCFSVTTNWISKRSQEWTKIWVDHGAAERQPIYVPKSVQHSQHFREMYHQSVLVMVMGDIKMIAKPDTSTVINSFLSVFF